MATLEKRVSALENMTNPDGNTPKTMFATFHRPGDEWDGIHKLRQWSQGAEWVRGDGESEQDFKDRASREATRNALGFALLLQCEGPEVDHAQP